MGEGGPEAAVPAKETFALCWGLGFGAGGAPCGDADWRTGRVTRGHVARATRCSALVEARSFFREVTLSEREVTESTKGATRVRRGRSSGRVWASDISLSSTHFEASAERGDLFALGHLDWSAVQVSRICCLITMILHFIVSLISE